jgi:hypothetical protein
MTELTIKALSDGCITLFSTREFFGYGREILITPEARIELMDFLFENFPEEMGEAEERHMP